MNKPDRLEHDLENDGEIGAEPEYPEPPVSLRTKVVIAIAAVLAGIFLAWLGVKVFTDDGSDGLHESERALHEGDAP